MNPEIKTKWISALRSGEYKKTSGVLARHNETRDGMCFCALGVLCDLYVKEAQQDMNIAWEYCYDYGEYLFTLNGCTGILPESVRQWADLPCADPEVPASIDGTEGLFPISELNDQYMRSFYEIADILESSSI